ncbi:BPG_G0017050.mRNA.1.CDS.1 [Saccharomyces cerevisiae]|nr:BPG_G0017050.mRNA.1.CDS.1 [Saccharomyces cerevisiae]CAI7110479.1 BPG_G0017050.mRNA.1.CDS.1 [Saccharomyces cerevisiae]
MAFNKVTLLLKWFGDIRNKCQKSRYQLNVNVGLIFLGCTFDLLNVASMISLIDDLAKTYNISYTTASWSLTSYAVTFAGFIACMGRLGDIVGNSVLFTISSGSILIVVGLTEGGESWNRPVTYVTLIIGIILFFGFFVWNCTYAKIVRGIRCVGIDTSKYFEKVQLLIPVDVLFMKNFIPIVLAFALNNACLFSCLYIIDQYSQYAERDSPLLAGVKLVPLIICMVIGNALCAFESTKLKPRVGIAVGGAPDQSKGIASGVAQTFGQLGIEITFSVMASVLGNINEMKGRTDAVQKFRTGFQNCSYFTVAVGALGFLVTAICIRDIHPPNDDNSDLESSIHRTKIEIDQEKSGSEGEA